MPVMQCQSKNKKGWKFGKSGKCYTGKNARENARKQGQAIKVKQPCPGSKIRSKGKGRGLGVGKGKGPIGRQKK